MELKSCFQLDQFESVLLPQNNRPLEPSVLLALKELFNRSNADTTALHMLSVDCQVPRCTKQTFRILIKSDKIKYNMTEIPTDPDSSLQVARIVGVTDEQKTIMGVESGLELLTLPHGCQLRQDLLERYMQQTQKIITIHPPICIETSRLVFEQYCSEFESSRFFFRITILR